MSGSVTPLAIKEQARIIYQYIQPFKFVGYKIIHIPYLIGNRNVESAKHDSQPLVSQCFYGLLSSRPVSACKCDAIALLSQLAACLQTNAAVRAGY